VDLESVEVQPPHARRAGNITQRTRSANAQNIDPVREVLHGPASVTTAYTVRTAASITPPVTPNNIPAPDPFPRCSGAS